MFINMNFKFPEGRFTKRNFKFLEGTFLKEKFKLWGGGGGVYKKENSNSGRGRL